MNNLHEYLKKEWIYNCHRKYHYLFEDWFKNLTENQIIYFSAFMIGNKTPWIG